MEISIQQLEFSNFNTECLGWFHPSVTKLADGRWMATMQLINGSDHYGDPAFSISEDEGVHWSKPEPIPALASYDLPELGLREAVADPRPFTSPVDGTVFVFGCTTHYSSKGNISWDKSFDKSKQPKELAVYATWRPETGWSERKILDFPDKGEGCRTACTQIAFMKDGRCVVPVYLGVRKGVYCGYDTLIFGAAAPIYRQNGEVMEYIDCGKIFVNNVGRGSIEPSAVILNDGKVALTMRAEDGSMYVSVSEDGMNWPEAKAWTWDDGSAIQTDSTQQHWIRLGDKVCLAFTMNDGTNTSIMRFRAPLYIAEANPEAGTLVKSSLKVLFERRVLKGEEARYGNFHCTQLDADTGLATDSATHVYPKGNDEFDFLANVVAAKVTMA